MFKRSLTILCLLILFELNCLSQLANAQDLTDPFTDIYQVEHLFSNSNLPPPVDANWGPLELPYGSRLGIKESSGQVIWMRLPLAKPNSDELYSLFFNRYNLAIDVFMNGEKIGGDTYKEGRHTTSWNYPRLVNIQNSNWKPGSNTVHIRFQASYLGGAFGKIVFGETAQLTEIWEDTLFKRVEVSGWLQLLGILVSILSFILWIMRRNDISYLLLAGMAISWTVLATHMVVYYNVMDYQYWLPLVHLALHFFSFLYYKLLTNLGEYENPLLDKFILAWLILAVAWNQLGPFTYWWMGSYAFHALGSLAWVYMLGRIAHRAITENDRLASAISITVVVQLGLFSHDFFMILFGEDEKWETAMHLSQFAFPFLLVIFAGILLNRFHSALSLAESLNRELEAKVEASRKVIEQAYAQRRQLELDQAAEKQRLAIYRDLHDDVGSKLLSIVHAGRDNKLGELARTALESLRSAVSKANSKEQQLSQLLENIREESQLRLEGSGHRLLWNQPNNLPQLLIPADHVFNINQIFRELVSNIIRHANADTVEVTFLSSDSYWQISIQDNGVGFSDCNMPGNGLKNVQQRVLEIGGKLHRQNSTEQGASISIEIPRE